MIKGLPGVTLGFRASRISEQAAWR